MDTTPEPQRAPMPTPMSPDRAALDRLSRLRTLVEVVATFGSARRLATDVLGRPVDGGHATKPVVRLVGQLLQHPLGPSVAADALTLAHLAAGSVDTTTVELLLAGALGATQAFRPMDESDREALEQLLEFTRTPAQKRKVLTSLWRLEGDDPTRSSSARDLPRSFDATWEGLSGPYLRFDHWELAPGLCEFDFDDPFPEDRLDRLSPADRLERLAAMDPLELCNRFRHSELPEDPDECRTVLFGAMEAVLGGSCCPEDLRLRVRYPRDAASALMALLAGPDRVEPFRLRRWVQTAPAADLEWLAEQAPVHLCGALNWLGLLDVGWFTHGPLRGVDLQNVWIVRASFVRTRDRRPSHVHPLLAELQARPDVAVSPDAGRWCEPYSPAEDPRLALELARHATGHLSRWAPRLYSVVTGEYHRHLIGAQDLANAGSLPASFTAVAHGVPAVNRPARSGSVLRRELEVAYRGGPFSYQPAIVRLDGAVLPNHPEWAVRLPVDVADLRRNSLEMANCTSGYVDEIIENTTAILILDGPDGERLNASVHDRVPAGNRWRVGEINSVGNDGNPHEWIHDALQDLVDRCAQRVQIRPDDPLRE